MTNSFDPKAATSSLRDFQRATVDHVAERLFRQDGSRRFLVADETGLGKSLVARGLVAETIARFEHDDDIDRIDIVYVCSSTELARQNLERLDCLGLLDTNHRISTDRLSLLALAGDDFTKARPELGVSKPVNLIAFTPGTSFDHGTAWGQARERALIARMIERFEDLSHAQWRRLRLAFTGNAPVGFGDRLDSVLRQIETTGINEEVVDRFEKTVRTDGSLNRLHQLLDDIGRRQKLDETLTEQARTLCAHFRATLAHASVDALEPDLVILDEFQRFRSLLDRESGPAAELAHELFGHPDAHVILLSATPYKPFTLAAERDGEHDDDHYRDLIATLSFLAGDDKATIRSIEADLARFRRSVSAGETPGELATQLGRQLRTLMVRTERPPHLVDTMLHAVEHQAGVADADDLIEHARLRQLADTVGSRLPVDYWKSIPLFANHLDDYDLGRRVDDALADPSKVDATERALKQLRSIDRDGLTGPIEPGNARYGALAEDVLDSGMWRLPWLAPSLPYVEPAGPWADPKLAGATKRLVFSNWSAVPASLVTLLSHNARWNATKGRTIRPRLQYSMSNGRPSGMTTLALFWPHPVLAELVDPLRIRRERGGPTTANEVAATGADLIHSIASTGRSEGNFGVWESYFAVTGAFPNELFTGDLVLGDTAVTDALLSMLGSTDRRSFPDADHAGIDGHFDRVMETRAQSAVPDARDVNSLAELAAFGPANIAWRALGSVIRPEDDVTNDVRWIAAALLADGIRSLFNRDDIACLLDDDDRFAEDTPYWRRVVSTCADGNLQAVLEEFLSHLRPPTAPRFAPSEYTNGSHEYDGHGLVAVAHSVSQALSLRESTLRLFDPSDPENKFGMQMRFAVRYGGKVDRQSDSADRLGEVRNAFNSPFWPYVLASTSVGQEGIDFHWWCHAIVHWNLPASPVDFEQREGRVHRFAGHAVRRNVAAEHGAHVLEHDEDGLAVWDRLWELARDRRHLHGDLSPEWIYTGPHKVERHVFPYALSRDTPQLERLERSRALYRLAFGQTRQEDMLELLERPDADFDLDAMRIDLRPDGMRLTAP